MMQEPESACGYPAFVRSWAKKVDSVRNLAKRKHGKCGENLDYNQGTTWDPRLAGSVLTHGPQTFTWDPWKTGERLLSGFIAIR
jgi:hypothetical protein